MELHAKRSDAQNSSTARVNAKLQVITDKHALPSAYKRKELADFNFKGIKGSL